MPYFPFNFPYIFGEKLVDSQTVTATATSTAVASVTKYAESHLHSVVSSSSSAFKDARVTGSLEVTAEGVASFARETYGAAIQEALAGSEGDSQEQGYAETSSDFLASTSAAISKGQLLDASFAAQWNTESDTSRLARFSAHLATTAQATGYYGNPTAISPQKSESFIETFNFKDEFRWSGWETGPSVVNGQLVVPIDGAGIYSVGNRNSGDGILNLNSHQLTIQLVSPPTGSSNALAQFVIRPEFGFPEQTEAEICIQMMGGNWRFLQRDGDGDVVSMSTTPYSTGSWVRIRLIQGIVYWDISDNGLFWSNEKDEPVASAGYGASSVAFLSDPNGGITTTTAVWDNLNAEPRAIQASLAIFTLDDVVASRGQFLDAELASAAETSGFNRYDANAQAALSLDAILYSEMMKTLNASVSLGILHEVSADGTEYGIADSDLALVADVSAEMVSNQIISAYTNVVHESAGLLSRGQFIQSFGTSIDSYTTAEGFCIYRSGSSLSAWAFPAADALRDARAGAEFGAEAAYDVVGTEFGIAESDTLPITFVASGELQKDQKIDTSTYVVVWRSASGLTQRFATSSLQASAYGTGTLDEPFLIVTVPEDIRSTDVAASPRSSIVKSDNRIAYVQDHKQKV